MNIIMRRIAIWAAAMVAMTTTLWAQSPDNLTVRDEVNETERLRTADPDTLSEEELVIWKALNSDRVHELEERHVHSTYVTSRSYDDHIYIRWAPDEYTSWRLLNLYGYKVVRIQMGKKEFKTDTLAHIKPLSLEQFMETFEVHDTLAAAAAQVIYGKRT